MSGPSTQTQRYRNGAIDLPLILGEAPEKSDRIGVCEGRNFLLSPGRLPIPPLGPRLRRVALS